MPRPLPVLCLSALLVLAHSVHCLQAARAEPIAPADKTLRLREIWRLGDDDGDVPLGSIMQVLGDRRGRIYLLDHQLCHIQVVDSTGLPLRTLSREGNGPGEIRFPLDMFFVSDDRIGVLQAVPAKIVTIGLDGVPGPGIHLGQGRRGEPAQTNLLGGRANAGCLVLWGAETKRGDGDILTERRFLSRFDLTGRRVCPYLEREIVHDYRNRNWDEEQTAYLWGRCDIDSDGRLYVAPHRNRYQIDVYGPTGELLFSIEKAYESLPRPGFVQDQIRKAMERAARRFGPDVDVDMPSTFRDIHSIQCAPDGTLWVRTSRGDEEAPAGALCVVDVFSRTGRFLHSLTLITDDGARGGAIFFTPAGRIIRRAEFDLEGRIVNDGGFYTGIVCYAIQGGGGQDF